MVIQNSFALNKHSTLNKFKRTDKLTESSSNLRLELLRAIKTFSGSCVFIFKLKNEIISEKQMKKLVTDNEINIE